MIIDMMMVCVCVISADPLAHITRGLREHLMEKALRALVTPGYKDHIGLSTHNTTNWYMHCTHCVCNYYNYCYMITAS